MSTPNRSAKIIPNRKIRRLFYYAPRFAAGCQSSEHHAPRGEEALPKGTHRWSLARSYLQSWLETDSADKRSISSSNWYISISWLFSILKIIVDSIVGFVHAVSVNNNTNNKTNIFFIQSLHFEFILLILEQPMRRALQLFLLQWIRYQYRRIRWSERFSARLYSRAAFDFDIFGGGDFSRDALPVGLFYSQKVYRLRPVDDE